MATSHGALGHCFLPVRHNLVLLVVNDGRGDDSQRLSLEQSHRSRETGTETGEMKPAQSTMGRRSRSLPYKLESDREGCQAGQWF